MSWPYNTNLVEGVAVLANYITTSVTANMGSLKCGPFYAANLRRVVFDVTQWAAAATNTTTYVALQGATTSGATFYTLTGPDTTYPSLVTSSFTAGGTITTSMTTALNFVRFEYKAETIRNGIDVYNKANTTKAGPWIQLAINPTGGSSGSGTVALSIVAYGVFGYSPSADVQVNQFLGVQATNGALITTVVCKNTQAYIDGWALSNTNAFATNILPY